MHPAQQTAPQLTQQSFPKRGGYLLAARAASFLPLIAMRAGQGYVFVLDGGNRFNAFHVARAIRFQTIHLYEWQARVHISRAFTCHEMTTLLARLASRHTPATPAPVFILDLLATFYDDAVTDAESIRLLGRCLRQIRRLQQHAPVFVNHPPSAIETKTLPSPPRNERDTQRVNLANLLRRSLQPLHLDTLQDTLMGKTIPTTTDLIREMESILAKFRQVLHPTQRAHLDALIVKAKQHTAAISQANHLLPFESIQLAMLLEQEIENAQLAARLAALERKISQLENEHRKTV
jgi:cell division protein FtsB